MTLPRSADHHHLVVPQLVWIWALWLFSQAWVTTHIWFPKSFRLAPTEKLFVTPMYSALLIDQSLALNRRRDDQPDITVEVRLRATSDCL